MANSPRVLDVHGCTLFVSARSFPDSEYFLLRYPFLSSSPQRSLPEGLGVLLSYVDLLTMEVFMPLRQDSQNITRVLLLVKGIRVEVPNLN